MEKECKHCWASLLAKAEKKITSTCLYTCLKCGLLKVGKQTIRISRSRLDMGNKPILACTRGTGAGLRGLYAGDETERSVIGTTETEIKFFRMIRDTSSGKNYTRIFFVGEGRVTAGTGSLRVSIGGAASVLVWNFTNTVYAHQEGFIDVAWADNTIHTISIRLMNSTTATTFNRTLEVYVE